MPLDSNLNSSKNDDVKLNKLNTPDKLNSSDKFNFSNNVKWIDSNTQSKFKISPIHKTNDTTSFWYEIPQFQFSTDESVNRFIIEKIEIDEKGRKILHGKEQIAIISGIFKDTEFKIGQKVGIYNCHCCNNMGLCYKSNSTECDDYQSKRKSNSKCIDGFYSVDIKKSSIVNERILNECINSKSHSDDGCYSKVSVQPLNDYHSNITNSKLSFIDKNKIHLNVNDKNNFIIIEDDLITVTTFCTGLECLNNPIIKNLVADFSFEYSHKSLIIGIIIHQLIQSALINKKSSFEFLTTETKKIIKENLILIYCCNTTDKEILNEVLKNIKNIIKFLDKNFNVQKIEHKIHSMCYGLKGSIDCLMNKNKDEFLIIEIKTGKTMSLEHRSQAILYTIIMADMNCKVSFKPLLYYVKSGEFVEINIQHEEIVGLLKLRNDIACRNSNFDCNKCPENSLCSIIKNIQSLPTSHFLKRQWDSIELEGSIEKPFFKARKISQNKERIIFEIGNIQIRSDSYIYIYSVNKKYILTGILENYENQRITVILNEEIEIEPAVLVCLENDQNFLKFMRWSLIQIAYLKYMRNNINNGNGIDSFSLPGGLEMCNDFIDDVIFTNIDDRKDLSNGDLIDELKDLSNEDLMDEAVFSSLEFEGDFISGEEDEQKNFTSDENKKNFTSDENKKNFTPIDQNNDSIDSLENNIDSLIMNSEDEIFLSDVKYDEKMNNSSNIAIQTVISKPTVLFNESNPNNFYFDISENYKFVIPEKFKDDFLKLNNDQKQALFFALNCKNYKIIHGMPGTGKSTVISLLIKILVFYRQKILLICFTHLAIENIINRLDGINFYRAKKESLDFENSFELIRYFNNIDLVVGTCYSFSDPVYLNRKFDYCLIDEGSQMHLLLSLIPISISNRFCIVGDHLQLKPLSKKSQDLKLSLFEYLMDDDCNTLTFQYRMGDSIMNLSNTLFYNNRLIGFGGESTVEFIDSESVNMNEIIRNIKNGVILCYFNSKVKEISLINKDVVVTTIDKFQGSESDEVTVIFDPVEKCEVIESSERLNVALTRARNRLRLIGSKRGMKEIELFRRLFELID